MLLMKRLKTILNCKLFYFVILAISFLVAIISNLKLRSDVNLSSNFRVLDVLEDRIILKNEDIRIIGYCDICSDVQIGDVVQIYGFIKETYSNILPNNFDYGLYLKRNKMYLVNINNIKIVERKFSIYKIKGWILNKNKSFKSYPYLRYILFGDNSYMDKDILSLYQKANILHLFAISGLHLNFFLVFLKKVLNKIKYRESIIFIILLFYLFLLDFSCSFARALMFYIFCLLYKKLNININKCYILLLLFSLFLIFRPSLIWNIGFYLSYSISFFLILFSKYIKGSYFRKVLFLNLVVLVSSFPFLVYNFYEINLSSVVFNMFVIPFFSYVIFPWCFLCYFFGFFDNIFLFFVKIFNVLIKFFVNCLSINVIVGKPSYGLIILYFLAIFVAFYWGFRNIKTLVTIFSLFLLLFCFSVKLKDNFYIMVNVGHGDMSILHVDKDVNVIDTGGNVNSNSFYYGKSLINYLKSYGISKIDRLFLTHGDSDHVYDSIYLINNFKIGHIYMNSNSYTDLERYIIKLANFKNIKVSFLNKDDVIFDDNYYFLMLNDVYDNENDSSLVLYCKYSKYDILFLGDVSSLVEEKLILEYNFLDVDILKVAHHGSKSSSSKLFLEKFSNNTLAFISCGNYSKYHHPNIEVIERFKQLGISYFVTNKFGTIKFSFDNGTIYAF